MFHVAAILDFAIDTLKVLSPIVLKCGVLLQVKGLFLGERTHDIGERRRRVGTRLPVCKGELIYVDEGYGLDMWDRISVPCALRMRSNKFCVKTF